MTNDVKSRPQAASRGSSPHEGMTLEEWREADRSARDARAASDWRWVAARDAHLQFSEGMAGQRRRSRPGAYALGRDHLLWEELADLRAEMDAPEDTGHANRTLASSRDERSCVVCGSLVPTTGRAGRPAKTCSEGCRKARRAKAARQERAGELRFHDEVSPEESWGRPLPLARLAPGDDDMHGLGLLVESPDVRRRGPLVDFRVPDAFRGPDEGATVKHLRTLGAWDRQEDGSPVGERWANGER